MRRVYVEFTRPKCSFKPFSWAVRLFEKTPYSHVRLRWINSVDVDIVYEAAETSVRFLGPLAQEDNKVDVLHSYAIDISDQQYKDLVQLCMTYAGVNYGSLQILGILLVRVFGLVKNPLSQGRKSQVCSEIVGVFLQEILGVGINLNLDTAGPKDIKQALDLIKEI